MSVRRVAGARRCLSEMSPMSVPARVVTFVFALSAVVYSALSLWRLSQHAYGLDLGLYDQAVWLLSRGGDTTMSTRGLRVFGHHVNLILYAFVPAYWLGAGPALLLIVQAVAVCSGTIPLYLLGRDELRRPWLGAAFAAIYVLYAPLTWLLRWDFHPEALMGPLLLWGWWAAMSSRWRLFAVTVLVMLSLREDTALVLVVVGIVLILVRSRSSDRSQMVRMGLATAGVSLSWYVVAVKLVIPAFNDGHAPFYAGAYFGEYGSSTGEIVRNVVFHPQRAISAALQPDRRAFYRQMVQPYGAVPLAGPFGLVLGAPQWVASALANIKAARSIQFGYTSLLIGPIHIALVEAFRVIRAHRRVTAVVGIWVALWLTLTAWSWSTLSPKNLARWGRPPVPVATAERLIDAVPPGASLAMTVNFLDAFSHSHHTYVYPVPFASYGPNWGLGDCAGTPDPGAISYLLVARSAIPWPDELRLLDELLAGSYEIVAEADGAVLAKRRGPETASEARSRQRSCDERPASLR